jgi:uncharacterized protein YkwD
MRRLILPALLALTVSGAVHAGTGWRVGTVSRDAEHVIRALVVAEHFRVCGKTLRYDSQLVWAARYKAQDMGYRNRMSHTFLDGKRIWDFYAQAGVPRTYGAGEIIGVNTYPDLDSPRVMFRGWMNSTGHRAIIRNCDYDRFGIGAFQTRGGSEGTKWYAGEFTNTSRP